MGLPSKRPPPGIVEAAQLNSWRVPDQAQHLSGVFSNADPFEEAMLEAAREEEEAIEEEGPRPQVVVRSLAPEGIEWEVRQRYGAVIALVNEGAVERDRAGTPMPREILKEAAKAGLLGFVLPKSVGGQGRTWKEWGLVLNEIGYQCDDTSFPLLLAYLGTVSKLLFESGRVDIIQKYVRPMVQGELLGGFAWTEGRDPFSFKTVLTRTETGYTLSGTKTPVADGMIADVFMIFARDAETNDVKVVLVERNDPGVQIIPHRITGVRAAGLGRVSMNDVPIPENRVLVSADAISWGQRFLNERRFEMPCWLLGRMRRLFETAAHELAHRVRYGLPLTEMQTVQAAFGRMAIALETSRAVVTSTLDQIGRADHDVLWDPALAVSKYHVVDRALEMVRIAQHVLGGAAVFEDSPYERYARDFQCLLPIAGTLATLEVDLGILAVHEVERRLATKKSK